MVDQASVQKGYFRLYPPTGGDDCVDVREDQSAQMLANGWTKTKKRAAKSKSGDKS